MVCRLQKKLKSLVSLPIPLKGVRNFSSAEALEITEKPFTRSKLVEKIEKYLE